LLGLHGRIGQGLAVLGGNLGGGATGLADGGAGRIRSTSTSLIFGDLSSAGNALEAIPNESGQIEITLRNMANKGQVQLIVKDSGRGVPENVQPRLFQPFMTTKEGRQGLSLSRARRYVDMHGGQLDVVQTGETGTTFKVELPIRRAVSAAEVA
jgi:sensor histidine kinase regulating citrate/malate metabolism